MLGVRGATSGLPGCDPESSPGAPVISRGIQRLQLAKPGAEGIEHSARDMGQCGSVTTRGREVRVLSHRGQQEQPAVPRTWPGSIRHLPRTVLWAPPTAGRELNLLIEQSPCKLAHASDLPVQLLIKLMFMALLSFGYCQTETEDEKRRFEEGKGRYLQTKAKRQAQMQQAAQH